MDAVFDNVEILPKGVSRLKNGKYRFKRESKKYGLKLDRVDESLSHIKTIADRFESTLQHYKKVEEETRGKSSNFLDMKNIYKRGKQYYVEFVVNGVLHTPIVTPILEQAMEARDDFRNRLKTEQQQKAYKDRQEKLQTKIQELREGLIEFDYEKLKSAINFLEPHEFLAATYDINSARRK